MGSVKWFRELLAPGTEELEEVKRRAVLAERERDFEIERTEKTVRLRNGSG